MIRASPLRRHIGSSSFNLPQSTLRSTNVSRSPLIHAQISRRLASSTSGPNAKTSWKSFIVRLGLAGGAVYYYNTSPIFGNEAALPPLYAHESQERAPPTLDSLAPKRSQPSTTAPAKTTTQAIPSDIPVEEAPAPSRSTGSSSGDPAALEAEASQQGAFNEETGEINWDCPCLGGMAHGPCGAQFREAFSCFVFSEADPKGMDCVDKFKAMQECFREHPDVYGAELEDDEDESLPPSTTTPAGSEQTRNQLAPQPQSNVGSDARETVADAKNKLAEAGSAVAAKAIDIRDTVKEKAEDAADLIKEKTQQVKSASSDAAQSVKSAASDAEKSAKSKAETIKQNPETQTKTVKDPRTSA